MGFFFPRSDEFVPLACIMLFKDRRQISGNGRKPFTHNVMRKWSCAFTTCACKTNIKVREILHLLFSISTAA